MSCKNKLAFPMSINNTQTCLRLPCNNIHRISYLLPNSIPLVSNSNLSPYMLLSSDIIEVCYPFSAGVNSLFSLYQHNETIPSPSMCCCHLSAVGHCQTQANKDAWVIYIPTWRA